MRSVWWGGNYAVAENPFFEGLPQNCVFNWEYQTLAQYHKDRWALRFGSGECLVAAIADHKAEVFSALQKIKVGRGQIILSTLDIPIALQRKDEQANIVAKKILRNMVFENSSK
jgi:beta-galactosidase